MGKSLVERRSRGRRCIDVGSGCARTRDIHGPRAPHRYSCATSPPCRPFLVSSAHAGTGAAFPIIHRDSALGCRRARRRMTATGRSSTWAAGPAPGCMLAEPPGYLVCGYPRHCRCSKSAVMLSRLTHQLSHSCRHSPYLSPRPSPNQQREIRQSPSQNLRRQWRRSTSRRVSGPTF